MANVAKEEASRIVAVKEPTRVDARRSPRIVVLTTAWAAVSAVGSKRADDEICVDAAIVTDTIVDVVSTWAVDGIIVDAAQGSAIWAGRGRRW